MPGAVGQVEKRTQKRVVKLFRETLGYDYLGDWTDRESNSNIEADLLRAWLKMVWLAKWIREHVSDPRVLIITDLLT